MVERKAKHPPQTIRDLVGRLTHAFDSYYCTPPSDDHVVKLAALIHRHGEEAYGPLVKLFADHRKTGQWEKTLDLLCQHPDQLERVVQNVKAYQRFGGRELTRERFQLDQVVGVMLEIPPDGAETYVAAIMSEGLERPRALWHKNTLDYNRERLRGVFGYTEDYEGTDYIPDDDEIV